MRTTLSIDDDLLAEAKELARHRGESVGDVVSRLLRQALRRPEPPRYRNGIPLLPVRSDNTVVTLELVNRLRDEAP